MNKHCTNPSCRKTFSTLNYGGHCPFCGKIYPQLESARKDGLPAPVIQGVGCRTGKGSSARIILRLNSKGSKRRLSVEVNLRDVLAYRQTNEKIKAIKALRAIINGKGFLMGLREAKDFVEAVWCCRKPHICWDLTGEQRNGLKGIEPAREKAAARMRGKNQKAV